MLSVIDCNIVTSSSYGINVESYWLEKLLSQMPPRMFVRIGIDPACGLTAVCFLEPPEDGWETEGDRFQQDQTSPRHNVPCPESWRHQPCCLFATVDGKMLDTLQRDLPMFIERYKNLK